MDARGEHRKFLYIPCAAGAKGEGEGEKWKREGRNTAAKRTAYEHKI